jgi:DNA repair exonuclease SbcCD ATPase subunit
MSQMRKASFYDAGADIYHLSQRGSSKENRTMKDKQSVLSTLEVELATATTKLSEAQARIRFHESTLRRALEAMHNKHRDHLKKIKANMHKHQRSLKQKVSKAEKGRATAIADQERMALEVSSIQTALAEVTRSKGRTMGEIESLSGRVRTLNEQLTSSSNVVEAEREHSAQLERNLHEVGKQLELIVKENKRLQQLRLEEEATRNGIMAGHGEQMRALSDSLDQRTKQLSGAETNVEEARRRRDEALLSLEEYRANNGTAHTQKDEIVIKLRQEVEKAKDALAESKRAHKVDGGRISALEHEVAQLRKEVNEKNDRLKSYGDQLGMERNEEHTMKSRVAELQGNLNSLRTSSAEQNRMDTEMIARLRDELTEEQQKFKDEQQRSSRLEMNVQSEEAKVKEKDMKISELHHQIQTLEHALSRTPMPASSTTSSTTNVILPQHEMARYQNELMEKDRIIREKDNIILTLQQKLKEAEAEVARRTLRAAGMAANKITAEKKRMQELADSHTKQMTEELRLKDQLLQEKENALNEERKKLEVSNAVRDAIEEEKRKRNQMNHEEEEDQGRQERWLLMQRMKEMEANIESKHHEAKKVRVTQKVTAIHENDHLLQNDDIPTVKTLPNTEKMERRKPEKMDDDMEIHLKSLVERADALREEYDVHTIGSPELISRVETLTLELAERIAIEAYDIGEHLFEIMDDMSPILRSSTLRTKNHHARPRDISDAKNTIAAAMSVARSRVRAALHLSRDGVLYWLLTLYGNVASLLQSLRKPELANYDTALSPKGKRDRNARLKRGDTTLMDDDPNVIVASRDLVRVCSNQWTERRWPSESSGMLSEVRAAVEKAAEEEYWKRYAEALSNGKHVTTERDGTKQNLEEGHANVLFWQLLVSDGNRIIILFLFLVYVVYILFLFSLTLLLSIVILFFSPFSFFRSYCRIHSQVHP